MNNTKNSLPLNDFEMKSLITDLQKDYDLIGVAPCIINFNEVNYIFYFKKSGLIFAKRILHSFFSPYPSEKRSVSDFLINTKSELDLLIERIDLNVFEDCRSDSLPIETEASCLTRDIEDLAFNVLTYDEFFTIKYLHHNTIENEASKLISNGIKKRDIYNLLFEKYFMKLSEVEIKIDNLCELKEEL